MRYSRIDSLLLSILVTIVYSVASSTEDSDLVVLKGHKIYLDQESQKIIRNNLISQIDQLLAQKHAEFSDVDLNQLKSRINRIRVGIAVGEPLVGSGVRNDAVNFNQQNIILLNYDRTKNYSPVQMSILQWHEALGALGYNDENYLLSSGLFQKLATPSQALNPHILKRFITQFNEPLREKNIEFNNSDGGVTAVGGGGDGETAEIKMFLLSLLNKLPPTTTPEAAAKIQVYIDKAIDTPIETDELLEKYLSVKEYLRVKIGINRLNGKITILINPAHWRPSIKFHFQNPDNAELLTEIATVIHYL